MLNPMVSKYIIIMPGSHGFGTNAWYGVAYIAHPEVIV